MASDPLRTLFLHDLAAMYDGELQLLEVLPRLADDTSPGAASDAFRDHTSETERHADNLRRCFKLLDVEPRRVPNNAIHGLALDYDAFVSHSPSREMLVAFALGAAAKTEQLEIASYIGLLRQAHGLGATDIAYYLAENLRVEQVTAKKVDRIADDLSRQQGDESGRDVEEFRWSYYTEMAVQTPLSVENHERMRSGDELGAATDSKPARPAVSQQRPDDVRR
jgi:ferritin-like metal-binding protein YciE